MAESVRGHGAAGLTTPVEAALAHFAERLTRESWRMTSHDIEALRRVGLNDRAIHDAVQVVAYFNYINRIADGLGVNLEPEMTAPAEFHDGGKAR